MSDELASKIAKMSLVALFLVTLVFAFVVNRLLSHDNISAEIMQKNIDHDTHVEDRLTAIEKRLGM